MLTDDDMDCHAGGAADALRAIPHGTLCSCKLLAEALQMDPRKLTYEYCRTVLQKHWRMTCRHGEVLPTDEPACLTEKWKDIGAMTPLSAILLKNA